MLLVLGQQYKIEIIRPTGRPGNWSVQSNWILWTFGTWRGEMVVVVVVVRHNIKSTLGRFFPFHSARFRSLAGRVIFVLLLSSLSASKENIEETDRPHGGKQRQGQKRLQSSFQDQATSCTNYLLLIYLCFHLLPLRSSNKHRRVAISSAGSTLNWAC